MSNQIYENRVTKYYQQTNTAIYSKLATQDFVELLPGILTFATLVDTQDLYTMNGGQVGVKSDGMYNFNFIINHVNSGDPANDDNEFVAEVLLMAPALSGSSIAMNAVHQREVGKGSASGGTTRITTIGVTTFMRAGDYVYVAIQNLVTQNLTVLSDVTACIAQKIY